MMAQRKDAKAKLLDAAVTVIRSKGLAATSVEDLCRAAGVTKGGFFHHFPSKEALAVEAAAHFGGMADGLYDAPWRNAADPAERVLGYVALRKEIIRGDAAAFTCLLGTMVQEAYASAPAIRSACEAGIRGHALRLAPDIAAALKAAGREDVDPEGLAMHVQAVIQGAFVLAKAAGEGRVAVESIDHLARYLELLFGREGVRDRLAPAVADG